jgi:signal transduction histidine kinase
VDDARRPAVPPAAGAERLRDLADECAIAFRNYVRHPDESGLLSAYELGRRALADGLGVLEMARVVASVVQVIEELNGAEDRDDAVRAAETFLVETLSPFEMAHRGFREANTVLRRLNDILEGQTRRIAAALHDEASSLLTPLHLAVADAVTKSPPPLVDNLRDIRALLNRMEDRLRSLAHELRPPALDQFGLVAALDLLARATSLRHGVEVDFRTAIDVPMPATVEATLYRVIHEALTNVGKHAAASRAEVEIVRSRHLVSCWIRDDGKGIVETNEPKGLGLTSIRERVAGLGGTVQMSRGRDGRGTTVTIELPLES